MNLDNPEGRDRFNPPVRIAENNKLISITIVLDDVSEEQIRIDLEKTNLTVTVSADGKQRSTFIHVPDGVRFFRKKFSNGILDIYLEKPVV